MKTRFLTSLTLALAILGNQLSAFAFPLPGNFVLPGHRRVVYRISDVTESDILRTCQQRFGSEIADASRIRDKVQCHIITAQGKKEYSFRIDVNSRIYFNGKDRGEVGSEGGVKIVEDNGTKIVIVTKSIGVIDVCEYKHPGIGAWASNGGASCDDSYQERIK